MTRVCPGSGTATKQRSFKPPPKWSQHVLLPEHGHSMCCFLSRWEAAAHLSVFSPVHSLMESAEVSLRRTTCTKVHGKAAPLS